MWLIAPVVLSLFSCKINAQEVRVPRLLIIRTRTENNEQSEKIINYMVVIKKISPRKSSNTEKIPENNQQLPPGTRK